MGAHYHYESHCFHHVHHFLHCPSDHSSRGSEPSYFLPCDYFLLPDHFHNSLLHILLVRSTLLCHVHLDLIGTGAFAVAAWALRGSSLTQQASACAVGAWGGVGAKEELASMRRWRADIAGPFVAGPL